MKKQSVKPNLFLAGAPKSGTSAIYTYLKSHPEVFMSERKEPQYFCDDFWVESDKFHGSVKFFNIRYEDEYQRLFKNVKNEKIIGEATSKYLYSKNAAENIYRFNPDSKIIIMLRNPVDFLYSYHSQCIYDSVENETDFEKALLLENDRKNGKSIPKTTPVPSYAFYSEIVKFSDQIRRYQHVFPNDQIKIFLLDDLKNKPHETYKNLLGFLDVSTDHDPDFNIVNPNKKIKDRRIHNSLNRFSYLFLKVFPKKFYKKIKGYYYNVNIDYSLRKPLNEDIRKKLMDKYSFEVENLSIFLNKDLKRIWGYNK